LPLIYELEEQWAEDMGLVGHTRWMEPWAGPVPGTNVPIPREPVAPPGQNVIPAPPPSFTIGEIPPAAPFAVTEEVQVTQGRIDEDAASFYGESEVGSQASVVGPLDAGAIMEAVRVEAPPAVRETFLERMQSESDEEFGPPVLTAGPAALVPVAIGLAAIAARLGATAARAFRGLGTGVVLRWNSLPRWARIGLGVIGVQVGADILLDEGVGDVGLIQIPGTTDLTYRGAGGRDLTAYVMARATSSWNAGGVTFYRLDDGRLAVQNKHGVWKIWRPKKPVVLFTTGAGAKDLGTLLKADAILQKASKRISKMLRNRGYHVARRSHGDK